MFYVTNIALNFRKWRERPPEEKLILKWLRQSLLEESELWTGKENDTLKRGSITLIAHEHGIYLNNQKFGGVIARQINLLVKQRATLALLNKLSEAHEASENNPPLPGQAGAAITRQRLREVRTRV